MGLSTFGLGYVGGGAREGAMGTNAACSCGGLVLRWSSGFRFYGFTVRFDVGTEAKAERRSVKLQNKSRTKKQTIWFGFDSVLGF